MNLMSFPGTAASFPRKFFVLFAQPHVGIHAGINLEFSFCLGFETRIQLVFFVQTFLLQAFALHS